MKLLGLFLVHGRRLAYFSRTNGNFLSAERTFHARAAKCTLPVEFHEAWGENLELHL